MNNPRLVTLTDYLKLHDISRSKLAKRSGVSLKTLDRWFTDESRPQRLKLKKVANALDVTIEILLKMKEAEHKARRESEHLRGLRFFHALLTDIAERPIVVDGSHKMAKGRLKTAIELATSALSALESQVA